ncbi:hypothetical protein [Thermofilum sp.]|uniref:hypothetical protein n=1 Tax=Thermofilum sp. TaxID=1961369 RepID=UPI0031700132
METVKMMSVKIALSETLELPWWFEVSWSCLVQKAFNGLRETPWWQWRGKTVLMSSAHDPYLPEVYFPHRWPRRILDAVGC